MSLGDYERRKLQLRDEMAEEFARHAEKMKGLRDEFELADEGTRRICAGLDESKILHAEHVIFVHGCYEQAGEDRVEQLEKAITQLLIGGGILWRQYIGTKSYDRWRGQGVECWYGLAPRHGSVIFQIGLQRPVLDRVKGPAQDMVLRAAEIEDSIYYLRNLERIQAASAAAKAAAKAI